MTYLQEVELDSYLNHFRGKPLVVDTEGTTNHPFAETWGLSVSVQNISEYFAFNHQIGNNLPTGWLPRFKELIESASCLTFHNAKHDLRSLRALGINYTGKFYDTMLMAHMVNENLFSKELDALARVYKTSDRKRNDELMKQIAKAFGWSMIPVEVIRPYGRDDASVTEQVFDKIYPDFCEQNFDDELWDWEQRFCKVLMNLEDNGILIDQKLCERELEKGLKIMAMIEGQLGFSPSSPVQLGNFLLDELGLPPVGKKGKSGRYSFDKEHMKVYDELLALRNDNRAKMILTYRGWQKTTSSNYKSYLEKIGPDGRLHCNYKQHGTHTGRLSCDSPNLQQIPRTSENDWNGHLKSAFIVDSARTAWELDYSQLELRLGAAYAKEKRLLEVFNDPSERDIFTEMSQQLGLDRNATKTLNYSIQYGAGRTRISNVFGVSDIAAKAIIDNYYRQYPGLRAITHHAAQRCISQGYIQYWTGRRRHFTRPDKEAHKAFNSAIQGGGFEIVKRAMVKGCEAGLNNDECRLDLQVHDSIRLDIEEGKEDIYLPEWKRVMEDTPDFGVKFRVDVKQWGKK